MKILKLLNKKNLSIIIFSLLITSSPFAEDQPVDIWNIEKKTTITEINTNEISSNNETITSIDSETDIYKMQSEKKKETIELGEISNTKDTKIYGLYDPKDFDLDIHMWSNSNGDELKNIFERLNKIDLSDDATEIIKIALLTNAHSPKINISEKEFLNLKSKWLVKNSDLELIEEYLIKNQIINLHPDLTKHLLNQYLSEANIEKVCKILSKNSKPIEDEYLSKLNIYCLIRSDKKDEAQLIYDLKKELGFKDKYFENKISYLLGYSSKIDVSISEKTIFDFFLAHQTNPNFTFEPSNDTGKIIWKYLSASNLLSSLKEIEISEIDKIATIEKAAHNKN